MIAFRAAGTDSGVSGTASAFVGIPRPAGIQDGDILVVGICLPAAGVTVTPPDSSWILIQRTDPSRTLGLAAYWKVAINEPVNWVFALSASVQATGGVVAYVGTDTYNSVEVATAQLSAASVSHGVASITASEAGEEYLLLLGGATSGTYTAVPGNFERKVTKSQAAASTFEAWRKQPDQAQKFAGFNATFSAAVLGASLAIILRPGSGTLSLDDVRRRIVGGFPDGVEDVYDLEPGGDYYKYFQAVAQTFKTFGFDDIDLLRREIVPQLSRYKLPDWERIFGLEQTAITQTGTIPDRQTRVVASWRAAAGEGSSVAAIQAALGPVLGYFPATPVQVLECGRAGLTAAHTYAAGGINAPAFGTSLVQWTLWDGGVVSDGGAQLSFPAFTATNLALLTAILVGPKADGSANNPTTYVHVPGDGIAYHSFPAGTLGSGAGPTTIGVFAGETAGGFINGTWSLLVSNPQAGVASSSSTSLFVEGIGPGQETGGAIFDWGVYADPALVGQSGANADYTLARQIIQKMSPAHAVGNLIQGLDPWPDTDVGVHSAIPDECIPA